MTTNTDELWQAYTEAGEPTGSVTKDSARAGALHGAVHVWIWHRTDRQVRVLLQQRSKQNATWPDYLDAAAAGHVDYGEEPIATAVRETNEEIGAKIEADDLNLLFQYRQKMVTPPKGIIDNELQWVYGLQLDPRKHFHLLDGEVESLRWVSLDELKQMAANPAAAKLIPHDPIYFTELFQAIEASRWHEKALSF